MGTDVSPQWPWSAGGGVTWNSVSDCYDFQMAGPGFAEFNGVDAKIELDHNVPLDGRQFEYLFSARFRADSNQYPFGTDPGGPFSGRHFTQWFHGQSPSPPLNPPILVDTWQDFRLTFDGLANPDSMKLFIDAVEAGAWGQQSQFFGGYNRLGVAGNFASLFFWDGDLRDVKLTMDKGGPNETVQLDMPLRDNARDLSPDENHGTTFNMPLPSL